MISAVLSVSSDAIVIVDESGRVRDFNEPARRLFGSAAAQGVLLVDALVAKLSNPEILLELSSHMEPASAGAPFRGDLRLKSGDLLEAVMAPHTEGGRYEGAVWQFRDLLDQNNPQSAVRRSEAIYERAIENANGVPYRLKYTGGEGNYKGVYDFVGEGIEELLGIPREGLTQQVISEMVLEVEILEEESPKNYHSYKKDFRDGQNVRYRCDLLVDTPKGRRWINDCAVPTHDADGGVTGSIGILQDITFRKEAELEARRLEEERLEQLKRENVLLREAISGDGPHHPECFSEFLTQDAKMRQLFRYVESIAATEEPVLIVGETGVGKEVMARAIHKASGLSGRFVPVNVAGLDDHMFSDTLFGHTAGAFTGAQKMREGLIESAAGGTLFLDEIGDLELKSQVKLLRLIQEKEYYPIGSDTQRRSRARILFATNRDLQKMVASGDFRKDLFFRLQTHVVGIPPLRERSGDIPLLTSHFITHAAKRLGKKEPAIPKEIGPLLKNYSFPGNIRELEAMIFDAVSKHESHMMSLDPIRTRIANANELDEPDSHFSGFAQLSRLPSLKHASRELIKEALRRAEGNQSVAAGLLGITQQALSQRLKRDKSLIGSNGKN